MVQLRGKFWIVLVGGLFLVGVTLIFVLDFVSSNPGHQERTDGGYYTLLDEEGKAIDATTRQVSVGDQLIAGDNKLYRIWKVKGDTAYLKFLGLDKEMVAMARELAESLPAQGKVTAANGKASIEEDRPKKPRFNKPVAIYHTHSDESYVPTDGRANIPAKGGIYKVGQSFNNKLVELGLPPAYDRTPHDPHDANAYYRSRRTAMQLMKLNPLALVDIHRDGVPNPNFYRDFMYGTSITKVRLVVGRQNPQMKANLWFAKKVKAVADRTHPGMIKGIFIAKGNYNQDLSPRAILLEVGTHTNYRGAAQNGASLFADAFPEIIREVIPQAVRKPIPGHEERGIYKPVDESSGAWTAVLWLILITVFGGVVFLLVSTGSLEGSMAKIKQLLPKEFLNALGYKNKDKS